MATSQAECSATQESSLDEPDCPSIDQLTMYPLVISARLIERHQQATENMPSSPCSHRVQVQVSDLNQLFQGCLQCGYSQWSGDASWAVLFHRWGKRPWPVAAVCVDDETGKPELSLY